MAHLIQDYVAFRNGVGIQHGAYSNAYRYERCMTFENRVGLVINARSSRKGQLTWQDCYFPDGVSFVTSFKSDADQPALIADTPCSSVDVRENRQGKGAYDFVRCDLEPADWTVTSMHAGSMYRVQNASGNAYRVNPDGSTESIPRFA